MYILLQQVSLEYASSRRASRDPPAAFLLGPGGVLVAGSLIYDSIGQADEAAKLRQKYASLASAISKHSNYLGFGSDELFVGRAGYICGALTLNASYKQEVCT